MGYKKLLVGLTALLVVGSMASTASARTVVTTFDGATSKLGDNGTWGTNGAGCTSTDGIEAGLVPNSGCYEFSGNYPAGPGGCVAAEATVPPICAGSINSTGTYSGQACGTGTATGTATTTGTDAGTFTYTIEFVAGVGTLTITGGDADPGTAGTVQISAQPTGTGCVEEDASGFDVVGAVTISY